MDAERIVEKLERLEDITIEVKEDKIMVGGNTYQHRKKLKRLGFRWVPKEIEWALKIERSE